jgi:RNA polymerase sigma-70 factor (ECF subfamily)
MLHRHLPGLRGFIRSRMNGLLSSKESSSDLVQSVCREVIEHIDRFEHQSEDGFRQWLYRTAERKTIDRLRYYTAAKRHAGREVDGEDSLLEGTRRLFPSPSRQAMAREELARAQAAFERLPEDYQTVIVLFRVQGLSHGEIARRLGRSEGAVRNLLYRGLAAISDALDEQADEAGAEG